MREGVLLTTAADTYGALAVAWILLTADAASLQRIFLDSPDR